MMRAIPMISYEDLAAASEWLQRAFGLSEALRIADEEGRVTHVELHGGDDDDDAVVTLGWPGPDYRSPRHHAEDCEQARRWLSTPYVVDGVLLEVADLDAVLGRARDAGAEVLRGPEQQPPGRLATVADPEGHRWMLLEPLPESG